MPRARIARFQNAGHQNGCWLRSGKRSADVLCLVPVGTVGTSQSHWCRSTCKRIGFVRGNDPRADFASFGETTCAVKLARGSPQSQWLLNFVARRWLRSGKPCEEATFSLAPVGTNRGDRVKTIGVARLASQLASFGETTCAVKLGRGSPESQWVRFVAGWVRSGKRRENAFSLVPTVVRD